MNYETMEAGAHRLELEGRERLTVCGVEDAFAADRREEVRQLADYYIHNFYEVLNHTYEVLG